MGAREFLWDGLVRIPDWLEVSEVMSKAGMLGRSFTHCA